MWDNCQWLTMGRWFPPCTLVYSTSNTSHPDMTLTGQKDINSNQSTLFLLHSFSLFFFLKTWFPMFQLNIRLPLTTSNLTIKKNISSYHRLDQNLKIITFTSIHLIVLVTYPFLVKLMILNKKIIVAKLNCFMLGKWKPQWLFWHVL